jgi:hypothetical protein
MATLTLKKKIKDSENIGQFALVRKSHDSKRMFFTTFHNSFKLAKIERDRLKPITDNATFFIICILAED